MLTTSHFGQLIPKPHCCLYLKLNYHPDILSKEKTVTGWAAATHPNSGLDEGRPAGEVRAHTEPEHMAQKAQFSKLISK